MAWDENPLTEPAEDTELLELNPADPRPAEPKPVEVHPAEEPGLLELDHEEPKPEEPKPVEAAPDVVELEEAHDNIKHDLFLALKAYGFDEEFLKEKEVVIVEKKDGKYVPRYVSHEYRRNPFFMFDNGLMAGVSIIVFVLSTPLFYKLFHSSTYKEVLGDMFSLVSAITSGGCVAYLTGKLASEIYKNVNEKKKRLP
jgi:hypothetical protein